LLEIIGNYAVAGHAKNPLESTKVMKARPGGGVMIWERNKPPKPRSTAQAPRVEALVAMFRGKKDSTGTRQVPIGKHS
jgi:hypothetical protein